MSITLHHHPFSRAAGTLWALEELGCPYELEYVDLQAGSHKQAEFKGLNAMGKLPTLVDGELVVTEAAAIALYLGDRYGLGELAPTPDDPARGTYLRWSLYAPSVIEPGCLAKAASWEFKAGSAGWGTYEEMLDTIEAAIGDGPWLLGERFSMADVIFGGTVRWMLDFGMLDKRPAFVAYADRLSERPAAKRATQINDRIRDERGLNG
ncbi:Disulfide-bond oxidoreductase YfcG [Enhygromyxa salina]|uniref:Disulfide-bond oxidoreductase YfcG n=1 Tax=Enhygromyxa salina TaxID=215803 RepID=A0A2S9XCA2_9BACT|nr:glutathione S-transferase family protein [Enhygromyxa salina]PRP90430.1 Disulfide-bond oxidoreductase YfcG [Enhygromyxa salina]